MDEGETLPTIKTRTYINGGIKDMTKYYYSVYDEVKMDYIAKMGILILSNNGTKISHFDPETKTISSVDILDEESLQLWNFVGVIDETEPTGYYSSYLTNNHIVLYLNNGTFKEIDLPQQNPNGYEFAIHGYPI